METCRWRAQWAGASIEVAWRALPFAEGIPSLGRYASGEIHVDGTLVAQLASEEYGAFDLAGMIRSADGIELPLLARLRAAPDNVQCEIRVVDDVLPIA